MELIRRTKASHRAISLLTLGPVSSLCSVSLERLHLSPWSPFKPWRGYTWRLCAPHMLSACTAHALCTVRPLLNRSTCAEAAEPNRRYRQGTLQPHASSLEPRVSLVYLTPCACACACACYTWICTYIHDMHMHIHVHAHAHVHTHAHAHAYMCMCMCMYFKVRRGGGQPGEPSVP